MGKIKANAKSKLGNKKSETLGLIAKRGAPPPTSFRLTDADKKRLHLAVHTVNRYSRTQLCATQVLQALISRGAQMYGDQILDAYKETIE